MQQLKNTILLLRIPFSVYLMPIFFFAVSQSSGYDPDQVLTLFFILHVLVYPASNGYNSYMDRDTDSIGGLEHPPPVSRQLFYVTLLMDLTALLIAMFTFNYITAVLILGYILASRAYSFRGIRLKKYPIISFLTVFIFQGAYIYALVQYALSPAYAIDTDYLPLIIASLFVGGGYPLTQIYQHVSDAENGDKTLSMMLGKIGTFAFSIFLYAIAIFLLYFYFRHTLFYWLLFFNMQYPGAHFL